MDDASRRHLPPEHLCPCRGGRSWEGDGGRVQAERTTQKSSQGQGNGPEGERRVNRNRSPGPGRRCPCGCPRQVVRLGRSLARGVIRLQPGGSPPLWGRRSALSTSRPSSPVCGDILHVGVRNPRPGTSCACGDRNPVPDGVDCPRRGSDRTWLVLMVQGSTTILPGRARSVAGTGDEEKL